MAVAIAIAAASLALAAPPASALSKNVFSTSFSGSGSDALSNPTDVDVDQSTGDVYVSESDHDEQQQITVNATGGSFTLSFETEASPDITYSASSAVLQAALQAIPALGPGSVAVTGPEGGPWVAEFRGSKANSDVTELTADPAELTGPTPSATIATTSDGGGGRVEKFTPGGEFLLMFGKEVNKTKTEEAAEPGNPHSVSEAEKDVCTKDELCQSAADGTSPGAFSGDTLFLAVDNSCSMHQPPLSGEACQSFDPSAGDLYVGDHGDSLVSKFDSSGHLISSWGEDGQLNGSTGRGLFSFQPGIQGIAVGPSGTLVVSAAFSNFYEFNQDGSFFAAAEEGTDDQTTSGIAIDAAGELYKSGARGTVAYPLQLVTPGPVKALAPYERKISGPVGANLALNPVTRDLYTDSGDAIDHFAASCSTGLGPCLPVDTFGAADLSGPGGLAIDASSETVYVADIGHHRVAIFTPEPYLPDATLSAATALTSSSATQAGSVDPAAAGPITGCHFEYAPALAFANEIQTISLSSASGTGNLTRGSNLITELNASSSTAFLPGERIEAVGLPPETTIVAVGPAGVHGATLALSAPATASGVAVSLNADPTGGTFTVNGNTLPSKATDEEVRAATGVEFNNIRVTGPPGGPYRIEYVGQDTAVKFPPLSVTSAALTPSGSTVSVSSNEAGGGWAEATSVFCAQHLPIEAETPVTASASSLAYGTAYRFRLTVENGAGAETSLDESFTTLPLAPTLGPTAAAEVYAETAQIHTQIDPHGGADAHHTNYHIEYLTSEQFQHNAEEGGEEFAGAQDSPSFDAGSARVAQSLTAPLRSLRPDTTYHYRVAASNECEPEKQCVTLGEAQTFTTLPFSISSNDPCLNAHVRQQTSSAQLLDCRAYELVSAAHTAGYDVESNLIAGQTPFAGYPEAVDASGEPRLLYGIHDGGIPGLGDPTNRGVDPYVATRTPEGWKTSYVGLPSTLDPQSPPFSSALLGADANLETFAFGGPGICAPCFSGGIETGIPLRLPGGELLQGMAGPLEPAPTATSDGYVAQPLSGDGSSFVFGSTSQFESGGNNSNGNVSIYQRDLRTGETHVISKGPKGKLTCLQGTGECHSPGDGNGIAELALSSDGSRAVVAQKVSTDADGNVYWHLYMDLDVEGESKALDLTPGVVSTPGGTGFAEGVLFDGMTSDGSRVFFTTTDQLLVEDTDESPDIYMWSQKGEEEGHPLTLISTGPTGPSNSDACDPVNSIPGAGAGQHWNSLEVTPNCGAVAIGGGGGVASASGSIYFLSPELLAGVEEPTDGTKNAPNLYLAVPGSSPRFIATLEPDNPLVLDALSAAKTPNTADFQVTPDGEFAAFPSTLALAGNGEETAGHTVLYRYDAATETLACASCTLTETPSAGDSSLASNGLSLTADGRLFFNSTAPLAASDTDERQDVYEWESQGAGNCDSTSPSFSEATSACLALISAGTSSFDSALLSADANGTDVYFFTHDSLAPTDENGPTTKIYDAREGGGFPYTPPEVTCKASDECHGAASPPPPPLAVGTESGAPHNYEEERKGKVCKKGFALKHDRCVEPHSRKHKKKHKRTKGHQGGSSK